MNRSRVLNRELFILSFIRYIKLMPAIWNRNQPSFDDIDIKKKSLILLLYKYRTAYPSAQLRDLKIEMNSLMRNFRSRQSRSQAERSWIDEMSFLDCLDPVNEELDVEDEFNKLSLKVDYMQLMFEYEEAYDPDTEPIEMVNTSAPLVPQHQTHETVVESQPSTSTQPVPILSEQQPTSEGTLTYEASVAIDELRANVMEPQTTENVSVDHERASPTPKGRSPTPVVELIAGENTPTVPIRSTDDFLLAMSEVLNTPPPNISSGLQKRHTPDKADTKTPPKKRKPLLKCTPLNENTSQIMGGDIRNVAQQLAHERDIMQYFAAVRLGMYNPQDIQCPLREEIDTRNMSYPMQNYLLNEPPRASDSITAVKRILESYGNNLTDEIREQPDSNVNDQLARQQQYVPSANQFQDTTTSSNEAFNINPPISQPSYLPYTVNLPSRQMAGELLYTNSMINERFDFGQNVNLSTSQPTYYGHNSQRFNYGQNSQRPNYRQNSQPSNYGRNVNVSTSQPSDYGRNSQRSNYGQNSQRPKYGQNSQRPNYGQNNQRPNYRQNSQPSDYGPKVNVSTSQPPDYGRYGYVLNNPSPNYVGGYLLPSHPSYPGFDAYFLPSPPFNYGHDVNLPTGQTYHYDHIANILTRPPYNYGDKVNLSTRQPSNYGNIFNSLTNQPPYYEHNNDLSTRPPYCYIPLPNVNDPNNIHFMCHNNSWLTHKTSYDQNDSSTQTDQPDDTHLQPSEIPTSTTNQTTAAGDPVESLCAYLQQQRLDAPIEQRDQSNQRGHFSAPGNERRNLPYNPADQQDMPHRNNWLGEQ